MGDNINLEFDLDFLNILYDDKDVCIVEMDLLHLGTNRNKTNISKECVEKSLPTFFNKPIIYRLNNSFFLEESTDVLEHARDERQYKTTFIAGTIPESSSVEFVERDDKTYLRMVGVIHKLYQQTLLDILKNRNGNMKISIEMKFVSGRQDDTGILFLYEFKFLSACLLGKGIMEGIEGSQLVVAKFSLSDYNNHYLTFTKKEDLYEIPEIIKNNAKQGLELRREKNKGGTSTSISMARYLNENKYITHEKVKQALKYFTKNQNNTTISDKSNISKLLYGGDEGFSWFKNIVAEKEGNIEVFVAKEDVGSKSVIKINKSKDSMSNSPWGDEDKSQLKKDCLMASNYKELCKAVFLVHEEDFNNGTEGALGYPVMEKSGEEVVYNRNGLGSARAYATKNNEESVISELKSIYKHLEIPWDGEKDKEDKVVNENVEEEEIKKNAEEIKLKEEIETNAQDTEEKVDKIEEDEEKTEEAEEKVEEAEEVEENCKNCMSMSAELNALREEVLKYRRAEEEQKMYNLLDTFCHCYSEEDHKEMRGEISKYTYVELEKKVDNKIREFAMSKKAEKKDESKKEVEPTKDTLQFSVSPFGIPPTYDFSKASKSGLDEIIDNSGVKIKK